MGDNIGNPTPPAGPYHFGGILLVNVTTGKSANLYVAPPVAAFPISSGTFTGDTAEWIMECPNGPDNGTLPQFSSVTFQQAGACNVLDAPPGGYAGVALQNGVLYNFLDGFSNVETNESAGVGTVTINYQHT
jgi:Peptidase A4 family